MKKYYYKKLDEVIEKNRRQKQRAALVANAGTVARGVLACLFVYGFLWLFSAFLYTM